MTFYTGGNLSADYVLFNKVTKIKTLSDCFELFPLIKFALTYLGGLISLISSVLISSEKSKSDHLTG